DSPGRMMLELSAQARQRIEVEVQRAVNQATYGTGLPGENYDRAEQRLRFARQLAVDFGQDPSDVDRKLAHVTEMKLKTRQPTGTAQVAQGNTGPTTSESLKPGDQPLSEAARAKAMGLELLEKSRLELRKGALSVARNLAEQAFIGPYGVKTEAEQRLREID